MASAQPAPNPLIFQRADPWVIQHEGRYYFTGSVPSFDRIELRAADRLEDLATAEPVTVWKRHESGPMSWHIWAPELHFIDGKWYIHFAAGRAENIWAIRMWVLENDSPNPLEGEWVERGQINSPWDTFSLDATTFEHEGTRYLIWAQQPPGYRGNTALFIAAMENPWTIKGEPVKISEPDREWEQRLYWVNEGPAVLIKDDKILVTYSASGTDHNYCMGLLWANSGADLLDAASWHKLPEPVFKSDEERGIYGPGHNSFTKLPDGTDVLVYHARNFKGFTIDPLREFNRHARIQTFGWTPDGLPDFGRPRAETIPPIAAKPLFRDPVFDGAADPLVIWNPDRGRWWMFYTNRRATGEGLSGVAWVHGTRLGIAESADGGATWTYQGTAQIDLPERFGGADVTHWAPELFTTPDGVHHMLLTVVPGIFENWQHPRHLVHLTSKDLRNWSFVQELNLASDRVIDACILRLDDGTWRMWYNNERDNKAIYFADTPDLQTWTDRGKAVGDRAGEGPTVFRWNGFYWMITDVWKGLGVYRSTDALTWERQPGDNLLQHPGKGPEDGVKGGHADVVVQGDHAFIFYFTHPDGDGTRRSLIQVAELKFADGWLTCDRDAPVRMRLDPGLTR